MVPTCQLILGILGESLIHNKLSWAPLVSRGSHVQDLGTLALAQLLLNLATAGAGARKGGRLMSKRLGHPTLPTLPATPPSRTAGKVGA